METLRAKTSDIKIELFGATGKRSKFIQCDMGKSKLFILPNGELAGWCETETCADYHELQARLTHLSTLQRAEYPSCAGRSRLVAYPQLA